MEKDKSNKNIDKQGMHPRNQHRFQYDFAALIQSTPALKGFVKLNKYGNESIDFANPTAVKLLNQALLAHHYKITNWDIPKDYLCPPIPSRAEYIHHVADLLNKPIDALNENPNSRLAKSLKEDMGILSRPIPKGKTVKILDIGTGANLIYPIIGHQEYGWSFVGTDIDKVAIDSAEKIIAENPTLKSVIKCRLQPNPNHFFSNVIAEDDYFHVTMCNPPFHASLAKAEKGTLRKINNLGKAKSGKPTLNFGGQNNELWCEGGELGFITKMVNESIHFKKQCLWFSTLISKQENVGKVFRVLKKLKPIESKVVDIEIGNKISRILFWRW